MDGWIDREREREKKKEMHLCCLFSFFPCVHMYGLLIFRGYFTVLRIISEVHLKSSQPLELCVWQRACLGRKTSFVRSGDEKNRMFGV
jgi:hypothetical protein